MTDTKPTDTLPESRDAMAPADQGTYDAIEAAFQDDPSSIPEKFQKAENPVLEYMRSYKGLERKLHEKAPAEPEKAPEPEDTELPETVNFDLPPEPGAKNYQWAKLETTRNGGKLTNEAKAYLAENHKMDAAALADFERMVAVEVKQVVSTAAEIVGGIDTLKNLNQWVLKNKSRQEIERINSSLTDPSLMPLTLRGLLAESQINAAPAKPKIETSNVAGADTAPPYSMQSELTADLRHPALKDRWHPDHAAVNARIQARIRNTPPGVLM